MLALGVALLLFDHEVARDRLAERVALKQGVLPPGCGWGRRGDRQRWLGAAAALGHGAFPAAVLSASFCVR
jgi:hypothetical protein